MPETAVLAWRQFRLERRMFWRNPSAAFFSFLLPLLFLALFGAIFAGSQDDLDVIVPGIAGMSIMATTFSALAMTLTQLRESGVLKRMRGTPLPVGSYVAGLIGSALANAVVQLAIIVVAGRALLGTGWPHDWAALVAFTLAGVTCFASLGIAFSHAIPNVDAAPAFSNAVFLPTIAISGVFYDSSDAPGFLVDIARALPLTHLIDGLSGALVTGDVPWGALGVVLLWTFGGVWFAVRGFSWESKRT